MRYLILSDLHANLVALETVLKLVPGKYDQVVCLGDIVGYGPDPNEVIRGVRALAPVANIRGNHDKACCGITNADDFNPAARAATFWTREQLPAEHTSYLRELPLGPVRVAGFQIVHGSIRDEDEYVFRGGEAMENLALAQVPVTFFGHTHFQGGFMSRGDNKVVLLKLQLPPGTVSAPLQLEPDIKYLINPGSIGQPRDGDPRAGFCYYDDEAGVVEYWRVPYDVEATQKKMKDAGLPEPLITRLTFGR
jgi:predicted phosphodiesterase